MKAAYRLAQCAATAAFFLVVAGALVTSTGSSLAIPDWPLAYGRLIPPMIGGIPFEWGHRVLAGAVSLLAFFLAGLVLSLKAPIQSKILALAAAGGIFIQALFGGLTVLLRLPPLLSIAHACLGPVVFSLLAATAQTLSPRYSDSGFSDQNSPRLTRAGIVMIGVVFLQILFGAIIRHTGEGIGLHILWAFVVVAAAVSLLVKSYRPVKIPALSRPALLLIHLVPLQFILGFIALKIRFSSGIGVGFGQSAAFTAAHVAIGDLILAVSAVWLVRARSAK
ncbi:MAG: COX15/CtaA family protein [Elusimicrobiota bacterium]